MSFDVQQGILMDRLSMEPSIHEEGRSHTELPRSLHNVDTHGKDSEPVVEDGSCTPTRFGLSHTEYNCDDSDDRSTSVALHSSIEDYFVKERDVAHVYVCTNICSSALQESTMIMDDVWCMFLSTVSTRWLSATSDPADLVNRAVKLVCGPGHRNISLAKHFTAESIREWLLLADGKKAMIGTQTELACTALCGKLTDELLTELKQAAEMSYEQLKSGFAYDEARQQQLAGNVKLVPTYRLMLERDTLRPHMQCIEVVIGPDALTVCKKIAKLEDMRLTYGLLKGIVLPEGCKTCQLVVQLRERRGAVVTQPVRDPRHIAAYLVLALQYSGEELLRLLEQWHLAAAGVPLHPRAVSPVGAARAGAKAAVGALEEVIEPHSAGEDDDDRDSLCRDDFVV
jgi:hypothetical protein